MNTLETLRAIRKLISDPAHWTQGYYERFRNGKKCFCLVGAWKQVTQKHDNEREHDDAYRALFAQASLKSDQSLYQWNDARGRTHADVLRVIDRAIETFGENDSLGAVRQ